MTQPMTLCMVLSSLDHGEYTSLVKFVSSPKFVLDVQWEEEPRGDEVFGNTRSRDAFCYKIDVEKIRGTPPVYKNVQVSVLYLELDQGRDWKEKETMRSVDPDEKYAACVRALTNWWIKTHQKRREKD